MSKTPEQLADAEMILQLLVTGGFIDPQKLQEARLIVKSFPKEACQQSVPTGMKWRDASETPTTDTVETYICEVIKNANGISSTRPAYVDWIYDRWSFGIGHEKGWKVLRWLDESLPVQPVSKDSVKVDWETIYDKLYNLYNNTAGMTYKPQDWFHAEQTFWFIKKQIENIISPTETTASEPVASHSSTSGSSIEEWAISCHRYTNHLYDGKPYEHHLKMVVEVATDFINIIPEQYREDVINACWCHDLIEDCRQTYNDVKAKAGERVAEIVYAVTNDKGKNRKERAGSKYYRGIQATSWATFVKLCDRIANVEYSLYTGSKMFEMYKKENDDFLKDLLPPETYLPLKDALQSLLNSDKNPEVSDTTEAK